VADMLCTLADVKTMLNIPLEDASKDGKLNLLIKQYSALIQAYVGYRFARAEYVDELQCENNRQVIYCNHFPIQSVQAVEVGSKSISDFKLLPEYSVWGGLYRGLGWGDKCFTRGFTHDVVGGVWDVKVSYTAGYYLPDDENYTEYNQTNGEKFNISSDSEIVSYCQDGFMSYTYHLSDAKSKPKPFYFAFFKCVFKYYENNKSLFDKLNALSIFTKEATTWVDYAEIYLDDDSEDALIKIYNDLGYSIEWEKNHTQVIFFNDLSDGSRYWSEDY
jgi:hypothetical protein